jgi:hypothetical protein
MDVTVDLACAIGCVCSVTGDGEGKGADGRRPSPGTAECANGGNKHAASVTNNSSSEGKDLACNRGGPCGLFL